MGLRADFDQAVIDIFAGFDDVPFTIDYIEISNPAYVAGGNLAPVETVYPLDIFLLGNVSDNLSVADDIDNQDIQILFRTLDLPLRADVVDVILMNGIRYAIKTVDLDPADASTTCTLRKA